MKKHYIRQFQYDTYANRLILKAMKDNGITEKSRSLLAHILSAQQIWLKRFKGESTAGCILWPDWTADTFETIITENDHNWTSFLSGFSENMNFQDRMEYKDTKGNPYSNAMADVLTHVINHGTHHRAQISQHLKLNGAETVPVTDYIFYVRKMEAKSSLQ